MASFWDLLPAPVAGQPVVPVMPDQVDPWLRFLPAALQATAGNIAAPPTAISANQLGGALGTAAAMQPPTSSWHLLPATPRWQPFLPAGNTPDQVDPWLRPFIPPVTPQAGAPRDAGIGGYGSYDQMLADAKRAHNFVRWAFGPPSSPQTPQMGDAMLRGGAQYGAGAPRNVVAANADAPVPSPGANDADAPPPAAVDQHSDLGAAYGNPNIAQQGARARAIAATHAPPDPRLLAIGDAYMRSHADYYRTQAQYAQEGVDQMRQGWRDLAAGGDDTAAARRYAGTDEQAVQQALRHGYGRIPEALGGIGRIGLGASGWLGSPITAAIHNVVGQPVEDATGIPSRYTDFAAGLALPFIKRLPGMGTPTLGVPRAAPSAVADAAAETAGGAPRAVGPAERSQTSPISIAEGASETSQLPPLTWEEENRNLLHEKAWNMLQQLDPTNVKLQSSNPPSRTPAIEDIGTLNNEIALVRKQQGLVDLERHHNFPKEFKTRFNALGIKLDDYITYMWKQDHRLKPSGLHAGPNSWNSQWRQFLEDLMEADSNRAHEQLNKMLKGPREP